MLKNSMKLKFHTSTGIEPTPSCLPGERLDLLYLTVNRVLFKYLFKISIGLTKR